MESNSTQQQLLNFRAVTISDLNSIIRLYEQQQNIPFSGLNIPFDTDFGLPLYVAELNNKIVGYSYATIQSEDYCLKTHIDTTFSNHSIDESLMQESKAFFKNEWQNASNRNLTIAIDQLVNWLNNSNSQN